MAVANSPTRTTPSDASTLAGVSHRRGTIAPLLQTHSQRYRDALARLERLAKHDGVQVLIFGETGTGKSIFAQHLHNSSPRRDRIFQHVVLSSMNDALAPSDLFGHLPGSFSGARERRHGRFVSANGGTLFLDEIGKASPAIQQNLLDAVERHEIWPVGADRSIRVDVRIVAATNVSLHELADEGKFLPDLVARLDGFAIEIPPLRERRNDIPLLLAHFLSVHAPGFGYRRVPTVDSDLMAALTDAPWPGNVRELIATAQHLLIEAEGAPIITLGHCPATLAMSRPPKSRRVDPARVLAELEKQDKRNVSEVARKLGISRTTAGKCAKAPAAGDTPIAGNIASAIAPREGVQ